MSVISAKMSNRKADKKLLARFFYAVKTELMCFALPFHIRFEIAFCAVLWYNTPMRRGYRILSVEAADIYKNEHENGVVVGYRLPEKGDARFRLFKILLDDSLDSKELEKAYTRICRR